MKNRLYQILAFCCGLALLFPLAACQTGKTPEDSSASEKPPVESKTERFFRLVSAGAHQAVQS